MKILYLVHPEQDYLQEMTLEGLCSIFGEKDIFLYPMLSRLKYNKPDNNYILNDGKIGFTSVPIYMCQYPSLPELSLDEICNNINDFDYIIFFPRTYSIKSLQYIKLKCNIITPKLIMIDGEDGSNIQEYLIDEFKPNFIFKREMFYETKYKGNKIYPLPFSAFQNMIPKVDDTTKTLNTFGIFGNTNQLRVKMVKKFHELNIDNSIVDIDSGVDNWDRNRPRQGKMSYIDYMTNIAKSKIGLSCIGHGKDCVRFYELPIYKTMMMCINPKIIIPFQFKDKETAVFIREDLSNFQELLEYYLSHDKEREAIAEAGHEHLKRFHTTGKRAEYLLSICEGNI